MDQVIYVFTHIEDIIMSVITWLGPWSYMVLFLSTFMETGLVIFPWLPGESLIFITSTLSAIPGSSLKIVPLVLTFFVAAVCGDIVNYHIGKTLMKWKFFRRRVMGPNVVKAEAFFKRHGGKAIIFGRFVPVIRTFVPLVAGTSKFSFKKFMLANLAGVSLWVAIASILGYYFGTIPLVKNHLSFVIIGIAFATMLPAICLWIVKFIRRKVIDRNML